MDFVVQACGFFQTFNDTAKGALGWPIPPLLSKKELLTKRENFIG
jgi:hypothetical protein